METAAGIVLCGGKSSRMGQAKEWLDFAGEPLLHRVVRLVGDALGAVVVAARKGQRLPPLPQFATVVHDEAVDVGPLAGISTGLSAVAVTADVAFVTSCDTPLLKAAFITRLVDLLGDARAVVPVHANHWHPLVAVYRTDTRSLLSAAIESGERRVRVFAESCGPRLVGADAFVDVDPAMDSLRNVNTPEAFAAALETLRDQR